MKRLRQTIFHKVKRRRRRTFNLADPNLKYVEAFGMTYDNGGMTPRQPQPST